MTVVPGTFEVDFFNFAKILSNVVFPVFGYPTNWILLALPSRYYFNFLTPSLELQLI